MPSLDIGALQSGSIDIGPLQSSGGSSPINETLSDTFTFSDGVQAFLGIPLVFTGDQFSFSDQVTDTVGTAIFETLADSFTFSDAAVFSLGAGATASDAFTFSDAVIAVPLPFTIGELVSDSFTFSDAINNPVAPILPLLFGDFIVFTDAIALFMPLPMVGGTDAFVLSDSIVVNGGSSSSFSDAISFSDGVVVTLGTPGILSVSVGDSFTFGDFNQVQLILLDGEMVGDMLALYDSICVNLNPDFESYIRQYLNDQVM